MKVQAGFPCSWEIVSAPETPHHVTARLEFPEGDDTDSVIEIDMDRDTAELVRNLCDEVLRRLPRPAPGSTGGFF